MAATQLFSVQHSSLKSQIPSSCCRDSILRPVAASAIHFSAKNGMGKSGLEYFCGLALKEKKKKNGGPGSGQMSEERKSRGLGVRAAKRMVSDRSFLMSTSLVAKHEEEDKVVELCRLITEWGQEKQKDRTSGVLQFGCFADLYGKHTYHFMERYSSFENIVSFRSLPEHTKFMNDVRPLLTQPIALAVYEYWNGQIGHMRTPMGPKGEGGLDDATGQAGIGGGVSHKQQSKPVQNTEIPEKKDKGSWSLQKALHKMRGGKTEESDNTVKAEK